MEQAAWAIVAGLVMGWVMWASTLEPRVSFEHTRPEGDNPFAPRPERTRSAGRGYALDVRGLRDPASDRPASGRTPSDRFEHSWGPIEEIGHTPPPTWWGSDER